MLVIRYPAKGGYNPMIIPTYIGREPTQFGKEAYTSGKRVRAHTHGKKAHTSEKGKHIQGSNPEQVGEIWGC